MQPSPDPQVFFNLRDRDLVREGILIAEGHLVVERLVAASTGDQAANPSQPALLNLVCVPAEAESWQSRVAGRCPVTVMPEAEISQLAGFSFHRGVLAAARAPALPSLEAWCPDCGATRLVICPSLNDPENLGSVYRSVSALGWDAVGIGTGCVSPFSRRVLRVSMGNSLRVPSFGLADNGGFGGLKRLGFVVVGTSASPQAMQLVQLHRELEELARFNPPDSPIRLALVFGNEFSGLGGQLEAACDRLVTIPMFRDTDSLNVAVAAAIFMHELGKFGA